MEMLDTLNQYNHHKQEEKKHKAAAKELNDKLKEYLRTHEEKQLKGDGFSVEYYTSTRKRIDEDKLLDLFKQKGLTDYIEHKEVVTEERAIELIQKGKLSADDLQEVIQVREIENLRLKDES